MNTYKVLLLNILILILVLILRYLNIYNLNQYTYNVEKYTNNSIAIALLCVKPHINHINFLKELPGYDIYLICDSNEQLGEPPASHIHYIQIKEDECVQSKYINAAITIQKEITSWDKALYYFCKINTAYSNIWFIEDDVFIPEVNTIHAIDIKYPNADLLVGDHSENKIGDMGWHWGGVWKRAKHRLPLPWYSSMVCAIRVSRTLLGHIAAEIERQERILFIEMFFNTIAAHNNLNVVVAPELSTIYYRKDWNNDEFNKTNLFHPIKDIDSHNKIRSKL